MKKVMKRGWLLSGLTVAAMLSSCSQENIEPVQDINAPGTVRFTLALPGGEDVVYPTRAIHTQEEWEIKQLVVLDFKQDDNGEWVVSKAFAPSSLTPVGNGQYSVSFAEESEEIGKQHKFMFVANNPYYKDADQPGSDVAALVGRTFEDIMENEKYNLEEYAAPQNSSLLTEEGMLMSGFATESKGSLQDALTITNGTLDCHVDMIRAAARVDLYSNAPNLVITGAAMKNATSHAYLNPNYVYSRTDFFSGYENRILPVEFNSNYTDALAQGNPQAYTPETFAEKQTAQSYPDNGVRKAFYMFQRPNMEGDCLEVEVEYMLRDGSKGTVTVPFIKEDKTTGEKTYVDAERNHLYKIVLGNGEEVENGSDVTAEIIDEPWNVVDLPAVIPGVGGDDTGGDTGDDSSISRLSFSESSFSGKTDASFYIPSGMSIDDYIDTYVNKIGTNNNLGIVKISTASKQISSADLGKLLNAIKVYTTFYPVLDLSALTNQTELNSSELGNGYTWNMNKLVLPNSLETLTGNYCIQDPDAQFKSRSMEMNLPSSLKRQVNVSGGEYCFVDGSQMRFNVLVDFRGLQDVPEYHIIGSGDANNCYFVYDKTPEGEVWTCFEKLGYSAVQNIFVPAEMYELYQRAYDKGWNNTNITNKLRDMNQYDEIMDSVDNPMVFKVWDNLEEYAKAPLWRAN